MDRMRFQDQDIERFGIVVGGMLLALLTVFILPIVILSIGFSYLVWASFREKEEIKWPRSIAISICGWFITKGAWLTFKSFLPMILSGVFTQKKIDGILSTAIIQNADWCYFLLVPVGLYLFEFKSKANFDIYLNVRKLVVKSFWPFNLVIFLVQNLVSIIAGMFGVNLSDNRSPITFVFSLITLIGATQLVFAAGLHLGFNTPFYSFMGGVMSAYVIIYWYYFLTSKWRSEVKSPNFIGNTKDGFKIGRLIEPIRKNLNLTWNDINHHIHILGQPGAGKSVLLKNIYANQIMCGDGILMLDLKADISVRGDFLNLAHQANRMNDFMLIDLSHPEKSYGYNPLLFGNATELKDKIIGSIEWSEPHYKRTSESALLTVMRGFVWVRDHKNLVPTLDDVLVSLSSLQGLNALTEIVEDADIKQGLNLLMTENKKEFSKGVEGLKAELSLIVRSEFGSIFRNQNAVNILDAINSKKIILVNLDGQTYSESAKKFGRMLLGDLRAASGAIVTNLQKTERPQFTVIVDEFSDIVSTEEMAKTFVGFLNRCRGSGIGVVIAHQSLGDFKEEHTMKQIIDSTETLFSFVQKDPKTCEVLASIPGTEERWKDTEQTSENIITKVKTGMGTRRLTHEYIYHPNVFKNLNTGEAVYIAKKPSRHGIVKIDYLEIQTAPNLQYSVVETGVIKKALALGNKLSVKKTEYVAALQGSESRSVELEI